MIEPNINERMARFAPSQAQDDVDPIASDIASRSVVATSQPTMEMPDIDPIARQIAENDRESLNAAVLGARTVNPDEAARAIEMGRKVGVPAEVARADMQRAEQQAYLSDLRSMDFLRTDPVMANFLANKQFAETAHDDIGILAKLQPLVFEAATLQTPGGFFRVVGRGYERGQIVSERGDIGAKAMAGFAEQGDFDRAKQLQERMQQLGQQGLLGAAAEMIAQNVSQLRTIGTTAAGGAAIGSFAGPVGTVTGGALGTAAGIVIGTGTMEAGNLYLDMRDQGVSDDVAIPAAIAGGFLNGVIEVVGMKIASAPFKALASKVIREEVSKAIAQPTMRSALIAAGKAYGLQVGGEAAEEGLQEIVAIASEEIAKAADGIDSETSLREATGRVIEAFAYGGMASALLGGIGPGANLVVDLRRASATQRQQAFFDGLVENRKESKLAQRNPQGYERFLAAQAQDTPAETIYVDAATARDVLAQSGTTTAQLEDILPGIRERLEKAVETGGDVTIPTSQFGARLVNTELGNALLPHMRLSPEAMSATEAQAFEAQRQAVVEEARTILATKQEADAAFVAEAQQVENEAFEQVRSVGQFTDIEARTIAKLRQAMVVVDAAEAGMTPAQYQRERGVPLVIRGEGMAAPMAQAAQITLADVERSFAEIGVEQRLTETDTTIRPGIIRVPADLRGEGRATRAMQSLIAYADQAGKRIDISPTGEFGANKKRLVAWYKRLGFVENKGSNKDFAISATMYRLPSAPMLRQAATLDADYLAAVERGDMETAQRMVDEAADAAGYTVAGFHGLSEGKLEGDSFDPKRLGNFTGAPSARLGFFFSKSIGTAETYGMPRLRPDVVEIIASRLQRAYEPLINAIPEGVQTVGLAQELSYGENAFNPYMQEGAETDRISAENYLPNLEGLSEAILNDVLEMEDDPEVSKRTFQKLLRLEKQANAEVQKVVTEYTNSGEHLDISTVSVRLRMQNPLVYDQEGAAYRDESYYDIIGRAKQQGHDGVIIKNTYDGGPLDDIYVVFEPEQIKKADPVTRDEAGNVVPLSRRFDITSPKLFEQAAMSTRVPTAVKPLEDALNDILLADYPTFLQDAKFVAKNLAKFKQLGAPIRIDETATEQQQLEQIIEHMSGNLLWLHDTMDADIRERAKMWYVGGRRLVDWLAERHGLSPMQAATVFAVLSPQKNWYENVGLGIRIIDIVATQGDTKMDTDMQEAYLSSLRKEVTKRQGQLDKHDEKRPKRGKAETAKWQEQRDEITEALNAAASKVNEAQGNIDDIGGRTLDEVLAAREFFLAAIMVRWFDQTKNDRTYPVISPEGGVGSPMVTEAGTPASIRYGSYNEVAKAIAAYVDGRAENVHLLIGGEHKVRNFYNNLFNPADPRFATIDTHAIAAAYLMPLAGTDALVAHGLGGGVGNAMFGLGGGYAVFYEAYRRAAEARGIDPREMQSITWEAIRGMFEAAMKGGLKAPVAAIWKRYVDGEIDIDTARAEVMQRAGGITTPSWVALPVDMQPNAGYSGVSRTAADEQAKNLAAEPTAAAIMFEVAPDPANEELTAKWKALSPLRRQEISVRVAETIVPRVLQEYGIAADMVLQVGGWKGDTNVGFALRMPPSPLVRQIARAIGESLSQEGMFSISATEFKGSSKTGIIRLQLQPGLTPEQIGDLYGNTLYPLGIQGHATFEDSMVIALDSSVDTDVLARTIAQAVSGDNRVTGITQYEGWSSYDETRITTPAPSAEGKQRGVEGAAGRRRIDVYRLEAKRLVEQYLGESPILEQAAVGPARGGIDPRTLNVFVGKGGDVSTLIHELIHLRIGEYLRMARSATPPARVAADLDILFDFMGVEGATFQERLDNYETMSIEQRRPLEEKVTYNAEIYVYEGKAPSVELRGVFDRLAAWMRRVYKSIRDDLNAIYRREFGTDLPILTPEVRSVFDRMLASEEQIKRQEAIEGMKGLFQTREEAFASGMDNAEWAAYQAMQQEATEAAVTDLNTASMRQVQWLGNARARILRDLQKKHDAKRKEVTAEVAAAVKVEPVYRAMTYLRYGRFVDTDGAEVEVEGTHRLDIEKVRAMYASLPSAEGVEMIRATGMAVPANVRPDITPLGTGKYGMLGRDGLDPDVVAEMFGYGSGDEMVRALLAAKPMKEAVAERTDAEMLRRFGDMNTPAALEAEVQKALHNEARARMVAVQLRFVSKAQTPVRVMMEAAKQVAADMISDTTIRNLRPNDFVAAEARAARDSEYLVKYEAQPRIRGRAEYDRVRLAALAAGSTEEDASIAATAAQEAFIAAQTEARSQEFRERFGPTTPQEALIRAQRAQLYQNQLAAEALRVKEYVDKQVKYLRGVMRDSNVKRMGAAAADQVAGLLERFEVAPVSLKRLDERRSMAQFLADLEAAGVVPDIAEEIANEARRVNYKELKVSEFRDLVDAVRQIEHIGKNEQKMRLAEERAAFEEVRDDVVTRIRAVGKVRELQIDPRTPLTGIGRTAAFLRGFAAQHLKAASIARILDGGKEDGPLWNAIIRTANDASDMETRMRAEASLKLGEILKPVFALGGMGGKGMFFPSINRSLNREARIAIALNLGNDGNRQRLLDGEGWTLEQLQPVLESLTEAEWLAVQKVWDFIDGYRPEIAAKERRLYGKEPEWVKPTPFTVRTSDGKEVALQGGYYPVKYDPVASDRVATVDAAEEAKRDLQGAYTAATTRRSFVKARAKEVRDRPLLYTLDAAFSGVNDVIHDLAWHEWLISTNRLLRDVKFANAVRETRGPEFLKQLRDWTKDNATGARGQQVAGESVLSWLRQGISASGLGFNVVSAAMQVTGFNQSIVRVGAKYIGQGIVQFSTSPFESAKTVAEKSSFMAERGRTQFREINEIKNRVRGQTEVARRVTAGTYFLMMNMQRSVDIPTWLGAYQKALDAGKDDAKAVALADQAVRDSQGSGLVSDLAAVERGGPAMKLFTVFYSYMNNVYNMTAVQTMTARGKGKLAADYAMLLVVPVVLGYAIKSAIQPDAGDDELDPEALARKLAAEELSYLMGTMVIVREFGGAAQLLTGAEGARMGYGGPAGLRAVGEVYGLATQAGQLEFDRAFRRAAINTLGAFTGLPSAQINRTIDGIEALVEGEVEGPSAVLAPLTGVQR